MEEWGKCPYKQQVENKALDIVEREAHKTKRVMKDSGEAGVCDAEGGSREEG